MFINKTQNDEGTKETVAELKNEISDLQRIVSEKQKQVSNLYSTMHKYIHFKSQHMSCGCVIIYNSGRRLRLFSVQNGNIKTFFLVNEGSGTIYRATNNILNKSNSEHDLVVDYGILAFTAGEIIDMFNLKISDIKGVEIN